MSRRRALDVARVLFVLLALACAWWGFRGRWAEVADALAETGALRMSAAVLATAVGLGLTAAARRGVRVRLLLDDNGTAGQDDMLALLDAEMQDCG